MDKQIQEQELEHTHSNKWLGSLLGLLAVGALVLAACGGATDGVVTDGNIVNSGQVVKLAAMGGDGGGDMLTVNSNLIFIDTICIEENIQQLIKGEDVGCHSFVEFPLPGGTYNEDSLQVSSSLSYAGGLVEHANIPGTSWRPDNQSIRFGLSMIELWKVVGPGQIFDRVFYHGRVNELTNTANWTLTYVTP